MRRARGAPPSPSRGAAAAADGAAGGERARPQSHPLDASAASGSSGEAQEAANLEERPAAAGQERRGPEASSGGRQDGRQDGQQQQQQQGEVGGDQEEQGYEGDAYSEEQEEEGEDFDGAEEYDYEEEDDEDEDDEEDEYEEEEEEGEEGEWESIDTFDAASGEGLDAGAAGAVVRGTALLMQPGDLEGGAMERRGGASEEGDEGEEWAEEEEGGSSDAGAGLPLLDRSATLQHTYLGVTEELQGGYGWLQAGAAYDLPLLILWGVVLYPGQLLPLRLDPEEHREVLARALSAPPPARRLLFVACGAGLTAGGAPRGVVLYGAHGVGCTAEVRSVGRAGPDGAVAVVALGRQRGRILTPPPPWAAGARSAVVAYGSRSICVQVLAEGPSSPIPPEIARSSAAWGAADAAAFDCPALARRVRSGLEAVLPPAGPAAPAAPTGALELSYWAAGALPLDTDARQALLEAPHCAARLRMLAKLLDRADRVACGGCGSVLASIRDLMRSTGDSTSGAFVNPGGHVHDMATFRRAQASAVLLQGRPTTEFSWFQGYAWQIAICRRCGNHLGWLFVAVQDQGARGRGQREQQQQQRQEDQAGESQQQQQPLARSDSGERRPHSFWGLRRPAVVATDGEGLSINMGEGDPG